MAITFPSSPTNGQQYSVGNIVWTWNGSSWDASSSTITGNIVGSSPNVTLTAGTQSWLFDNTGNLTIPVNGDVIFSTGTTITSATGTNANVTINPDGTGQFVLTSITPATFGNTLNVSGTVTSTGSTNATGFAVGNSAVGNCAVAFIPTTGTPANMAIRDYSTPNSTMYFDISIGGSNTGGQFLFRGTSSFTQYATINSYGVIQPTKPAFRIVGGTGTYQNLTSSTNGNGILNANNWTVDYNQGSYLNSTTGIFTAPVAGLYQVNLTGRIYNNTSPGTAFRVMKNGLSGNTQIYIEWNASTSTNHIGGATVSKLAVGDTLALYVATGNATFDSNDFYSVAFLG